MKPHSNRVLNKKTLLLKHFEPSIFNQNSIIMVQLSKVGIKIHLILLFLILLSQITLDTSKRYSSEMVRYGITNASEMQYKNYLNALPFHRQTEFINMTEVTYIFDLPEVSIYIIYLCYFVLACSIVLSIRFVSKYSIHESQQ